MNQSMILCRSCFDFTTLRATRTAGRKFFNSLLTQGFFRSPLAAHGCSARRVARQRHAVHDALESVVVIHRVVLGAAIVPEGERAGLPAKAAGELRPDLMPEKIVEQRLALALRPVLEVGR